MTDGRFPDGRGGNSPAGVIAAWDKTLNDRIWASVDYASGGSWYGSLSFGVSVAFGPPVSVLFGYVVPNNGDAVPNGTFTTQLDVNL